MLVVHKVVLMRLLVRRTRSGLNRETLLLSEVKTVLKATHVLHQVGDFDRAVWLLNRRDACRLSLLLDIIVDNIRHGYINLGQRARHYGLVVDVDGSCGTDSRLLKVSHVQHLRLLRLQGRIRAVSLWRH